MICLHCAKKKNKTAHFTVQEIRQRLGHLESKLNTAVSFDPKRLSLSVYILRFREATLWRIVELGWNGVESFEANKMSSAMLLTRAAMETSALLWHLNKELVKAVKDKNFTNVKKLIKKISKGVKADKVLPCTQIVLPVHILDCIRTLDKNHKGFKRCYELISEFCHPNSVGNVQWYSKVNYDDSNIYFGLYVSESQIIKQYGIDSLGSAINASVEAANQIQEIILNVDQH
jgi:hypothetical protein